MFLKGSKWLVRFCSNDWLNCSSPPTTGLSIVEKIKVDRVKNLDISDSKSLLFTIAQKTK